MNLDKLLSVLKLNDPQCDHLDILFGDQELYCGDWMSWNDLYDNPALNSWWKNEVSALRFNGGTPALINTNETCAVENNATTIILSANIESTNEITLRDILNITKIESEWCDSIEIYDFNDLNRYIYNNGLFGTGKSLLSKNIARAYWDCPVLEVNFAINDIMLYNEHYESTGGLYLGIDCGEMPYAN